MLYNACGVDCNLYFTYTMSSDITYLKINFLKSKYSYVMLSQAHGNVQNMKPVQICTGFIFCKFQPVVRL